MHQILRKKLKITDIYYCPHTREDNCECRKPKNGMLKKAEAEHSVILKSSFLIGDRSSDILAGNSVNCTTIFIDRNYAEPKPTNQNFTVNSSKAALELLLNQLKIRKL